MDPVLEKICFRPIRRKKDIPFLCKVYKSTRMDEFNGVGWSERELDSFLTSQFEFQHKFYQQNWPNANYEIILEGGNRIGRIYHDTREDEIRVIDIALLPEYRGKGIGGQIMKDIIAKARSLGKTVRIHVEKLNSAMSLYKRLGFKQIGGTEVYDLMEWKQTSSGEVM